MSKKNIVLIDHEPYSIRRKELFYIDELIATGYHVEVWDMSQFVFPGIKLTDEITENYLIKISSLSKIKELLKNTDIKSTIFFVEIHNCWHNRNVFRLLSYYQCTTIKMDLYANLFIKKTLAEKICQFLLSFNLKILSSKISALANIIYNKYYHIRFPNYYLSSSNLHHPDYRINHPDYEKYKFKTHTPIIENKYIVFLDTYFPYHPDLQYFDHFNKNQVTICADNYHTTLTKFFDFLETKYHMPVVIAAHPKSAYSGNEFGKRKIIKYHTDNLIINASLILTQTSNAISYITLANKPVIFVMTNASNQIFRYKFMTQLLAKTLKKKTYNIDNIPDYTCIDDSQIENKTRLNYIYNYLTSPETKNIKNIDTIKSLLQKI